MPVLTYTSRDGGRTLRGTKRNLKIIINVNSSSSSSSNSSNSSSSSSSSSNDNKAHVAPVGPS